MSQHHCKTLYIIRTSHGGYPLGKLSLGLAVLLIVLALGLTLTYSGESKSPPVAQEEKDQPDASVERVRDHLFFLASDAMRGRASGSAEFDQAAAYVVDELTAYGLSPLFGEHYRQPFTRERLQFDREGAMTFNGPEGTARFEVLQDMMFMNASSETDWTQPLGLTYVGLGIHERQAGWNDYEGLDLEGRCAHFVIDNPTALAPGLPENLQRIYAHPQVGPNKKALAAVSQGATCVLGLLSPHAPSNLVALLNNPQLLQQTRSVATEEPYSADKVLAAILSLQAGEHLFTGQRIQPFPDTRPVGGVLEGTVQFEVTWNTETQMNTANVGAIIPGTDPALADEVIVLSAHIDGQGMQGTTVLNSANDNASSVAALLEGARLLSTYAPRRTLMLLFTGAEEDGLLGSRYFVDYPPVDFEQFKLNVNMEMVGKPSQSGPRHVFRVWGRLTEEMEGLARAVEKGTDGVTFNYSPRSDDDGKRLFRNADHVHFFLRGVPTLYFYGGSEAYHQPNDDPEHINYEKVATMANMLVALIRETDKHDHLPGWSPQE